MPELYGGSNDVGIREKQYAEMAELIEDADEPRPRGTRRLSLSFASEGVHKIFAGHFERTDYRLYAQFDQVTIFVNRIPVFIGFRIIQPDWLIADEAYWGSNHNLLSYILGLWNGPE